MRSIIFFLLVCCKAWAQDTTALFIYSDTLINESLIKKDSLIIRGSQLYLASNDSITEPVDYSSRDSSVFDLKNRYIYLYGDAWIKYQTMELRADYIIIDLNKSEIEAQPLRDSMNVPTGVPKFKDGEQSFDAQNIRYNFKSKRGIVKEVVTKESDIYIHGALSKFISKDAEHSTDNTVYNSHGIFTTCDAPEPHFGIYSSKQKIVPNKLIVVGPSIVKIHDVPAPPLMLPFGFFPISKNKASGLIFPKNYIYDPNYGFGLQGVGYYFPISDYVDLKLTSDIWFKGSFSLNSDIQYTKRYKYRGDARFVYQNLRAELENSYKKQLTRVFSIRMNHSQLQGAHPYRQIGGNVDFSINPNFRLTNRDASSVLKTTISSNFNLAYQIPNSKLSFNIGMQHSQNLVTRNISINFPSIDLNLRPINPFKSKSKVSATEKWYEKITLNYNSKIRSNISSIDTVLFSNPNWNDLKYGARHNLTMDLSFKILKYINLVPSINYSEEWFFKDLQLNFNPDTIFRTNPNLPNVIDTVYGQLDTIISKKFGALRELSAGASLSTQIYGQWLLKKGLIRGIRHVVSPSVTFSYAPDYRMAPFNYIRTSQSDSRPQYNNPINYLRYYNSPFNTGSVGFSNLSINYTINNRVETKYYSKRDSNTKKFTLLDNLALSGNYMPLEDSFKLSKITGISRMTFFKGISSLNINFRLDPYGRQIENGVERRVNEFAVNTQKQLFIFENLTLALTTGFTIPRLIRLFAGNKTTTETLPSFGSIFESFSINHLIGYELSRQKNGVDSFYQSINTIYANGNIPLTVKWSINIGSIGYDIKNKTFTYPDFGFERDLHCWRMNFKYFPSSRAFQFFIGVKPGSLDFIKIPNNRNIVGGF
ncbi:MAG: LPS-assembly protein LptD [Saprospiraceae bacterium]|nr:LPS-assembly protein LptD [Saprospiraceae bacterium]